MSTMLSPHFSLEELMRTSHTDIDNSAPDWVIANLTNLAANFLEPMRAKFGPLIVTSGYRCLELNIRIGGAATSAHLYGCAADVQSSTPVTDMVRWIVEQSGLNFDQVIDETSGSLRWCHIGIVRPGWQLGPRREGLVFNGHSYTPFK